MSLPSYDELYETGRAELQARRPSLVVQEGDITDIMLNAGAAMADFGLGVAAQEARKLFIDTAAGDDLTALVLDRYNIVRSPATAAVGFASFTRSVATAGAGTILAGTTVATGFNAQGERVEYTTDVDVSFALAETGTKTVLSTAVLTGPTGNSAAGALNTIVDTLFDPNITVSNTDRFVGGNDQEGDNPLRARARAFFSTLQRGTAESLEFGALTITSVRQATAVIDTGGNVTLYIGDDQGDSNSEMISLVGSVMPEYQCAGTVVNIQGLSIQSQDITVVVTARAGFDVTAVTASISAAITAAVATLRVGETLEPSLITCAVHSVAPDDITGVVVSLPTTSVTPGAGTAIRAGTISIT